MKRNFPNFLEAYMAYAADNFAPPQFHMWSCLSIIAGALERRVWLPWSDTFAFYPNIYVILVSMPGDGKSVALNKAVNLLQDMNRKTPTLNIMPNQVTEAKFIELMGQGRSFTMPDGSITFQNAGYYFASEASNSLKNVFGDFIACLTDFYDCPPTWERATKKDGKKISLKNVSMNLLAGSTFDYLGKLVNDENIMGGFASRLIYIVSKNKEVKAQRFQLGGMDLEEADMRRKYRTALIEDLTQISKLMGPMRATKEFGDAWEAWHPSYERGRRALASEKAQSLQARTNTNILKTAMLLCAAESNDMELRLNHWERAHELIMAIQEETPAIFREAKANSSGPQKSSNAATVVVNTVLTTPGINMEMLKAKLVCYGMAKQQVEATVQSLCDLGELSLGAVGSGGPTITMCGNPNNYL